MQLKLKELLQLARGPEELIMQGLNVPGPLQKLLYQDLPASAAYDLVPLAEALEKEIERYDSVRNPLLQKFGEQKEGTNYYEIQPENKEAFYNEMNEILEKEVSLPDVKIKASQLGNAKMSAGDLIKLKEFIES